MGPMFDVVRAPVTHASPPVFSCSGVPRRITREATNQVTRFLPTTAQALWIAILLLLADTSTVRAQVITVGPNVQISDGREGYSYSEVRIAADPFNPLHLVACSMQSFNRDAESGTVAFVSDDRGANWRRTLELVNGGADEECEFGNHGDVYFLADGFEDTTDLSTIRDYVYWSGDGGHSWQERPPLPFIDREQMAVDRTDGNDRDTLYIVGASLGEVSPMTGAVALSKSSTIYRSRDH